MAVRGARPEGGLEAFVDSTPLQPGVTELDRRTEHVGAEIILIRLLHARATRPDGCPLDEYPYQYLTLGPTALDLLIVRFPALWAERTAPIADAIGRSLRPLPMKHARALP